MEPTNFIVCLIVLLVLEDFVFSSIFTKFTKQVDLDGYTCPASATRFDKYNLKRISCVLLCAECSGCFGVFHDQVKRRCIGCGDKYLTKGSVTLNGTEYYRRQAYKLVTERKTFQDAKVHCQELGGHLTYIKSKEEQVFVKNQVIERYEFLWIGGSCEVNGGPFYWQDGTPFSDYFRNWNPKEPDNNNQHCVGIGIYRPGEWGDFRCTARGRFICEFE